MAVAFSASAASERWKTAVPTPMLASSLQDVPPRRPRGRQPFVEAHGLVPPVVCEQPTGYPLSPAWPVWKLPSSACKFSAFAKEKWKMGCFRCRCGLRLAGAGPILAMARSNAGRSISQ